MQKLDRLQFARDWSIGFILDIGCGDCPHGVGHVHLDMDIWFGYKNFVCADAAHLPFKDNSFDTVSAQGMIEHCMWPDRVVEECKRVTRNRLVINIPDHRCHRPDIRCGWRQITVGRQRNLPIEPRLIVVPEERHSHIRSINCFNDEMVHEILDPLAMRVVHWEYEAECYWMNWNIVLEKN